MALCRSLICAEPQFLPQLSFIIRLCGALYSANKTGGGLRLEGGREGPERGACCADPAGSRPLWPRVPEMPYCPQMGECQQPGGWARGPSRGDSDSVTRRPCNGKEPGM